MMTIVITFQMFRKRRSDQFRKRNRRW